MKALFFSIIMLVMGFNSSAKAQAYSYNPQSCASLANSIVNNPSVFGSYWAEEQNYNIVADTTYSINYFDCPFTASIQSAQNYLTPPPPPPSSNNGGGGSYEFDTDNYCSIYIVTCGCLQTNYNNDVSRLQLDEAKNAASGDAYYTLVGQDEDQLNNDLSELQQYGCPL